MIKKIMCGLTLMGSVCAFGQTVSGFENVIPVVDSAYNGSKLDQGKVSGASFFWNNYDTKWGSWNGFSFSSKTDTVVGKWSNQYSSISGNGANNSMSYAVAYSDAEITFTDSPKGDSIYGFSLNNSTYAYKTIRDGNSISKKFGGTTGNDTDYFRVVIEGYNNGKQTGEVIFYLADYRFSDNSKDYIVKDWTWVDLKGFGKVDEIEMYFESTDEGNWGINTPTYLCLDSLVYLNSNSKFRPIAGDDYMTTIDNFGSDNYDVLKNDKDPDGSLVASNMKIISPFNQGATTIKIDGKIEMKQNANAYGYDTCWYSLTDVDMLADTAFFKLLINKIPVGVNDNFTVLKSKADTFNILLNDKDEAKDSLKVSLRKMPTKGTAVLTASGMIVYTPNDTIGKDTLVYLIEDEFHQTDSAVVYINLDIRSGVQALSPTFNFSVFPNPTQDVIHVVLENTTQNFFSLTDMSGRIVKSGSIVEKGEIEVSDFPKGLYILTIGNSTRKAQQKIIVN